MAQQLKNSNYLKPFKLEKQNYIWKIILWNNQTYGEKKGLKKQFGDLEIQSQITSV